MLKIIKQAKNLKSGVRTLSRTVEGGTTRLGVNVPKGADIGVVNPYNTEFNNGQHEPLLACLDYNTVLKTLFPRKIKEVDNHIDRLLKKDGYFTDWGQ